MTMQEIHAALENDKTIHWTNSAYKVSLTPVRASYIEHDTNHETHLNGNMLEITCIDNGFGGLAELSELKECYAA